LKLNVDKTGVASAHPAVFFSGGISQTDSNAVDAAGNIYQAVHGEPKVFVYNPNGQLLATVAVSIKDQNRLESATNIAIRPGTTDAYMTVSGPGGGFVYEFKALAAGIRQSNGR
jgi:lactonase